MERNQTIKLVRVTHRMTTLPSYPWKSQFISVNSLFFLECILGLNTLSHHPRHLPNKSISLLKHLIRLHLSTLRSTAKLQGYCAFSTFIELLLGGMHNASPCSPGAYHRVRRCQNRLTQCKKMVSNTLPQVCKCNDGSVHLGVSGPQPEGH